MSNNNNNSKPNTNLTQHSLQIPKYPSLDKQLINLCSKNEEEESPKKTLKRMAEIRNLLEQGASPNCRTKTFNDCPLHMSCFGYNSSLVSLLIKFGADVNLEDNQGNTPINHACLNGSIEIAKILVENGCDINHSNRYGLTPLMMSCRNGMVDSVKFLLERGCDIELTDDTGKTALFYACKVGNKEIFDLLMAKGCNMEHRGPGGYTPIFEAFKYRQKEIMQCLIEKGAKLDVIGYLGETLMSYPFRRNLVKCDPQLNIECIELLIRNGVYIPESIKTIEIIATEIKKLEEEKLEKEMEAWRRNIVPLLLCTRKFCSDSFLSEENLPLDLFKVIFFETGPKGVCFKKYPGIPLKKMKIE